MKKLVSAPVLFAAAGVLLVTGLLLAFLYSPIDASTMGYSQEQIRHQAAQFAQSDLAPENGSTSSVSMT